MAVVELGSGDEVMIILISEANANGARVIGAL